MIEIIETQNLLIAQKNMTFLSLDKLCFMCPFLTVIDRLTFFLWWRFYFATRKAGIFGIQAHVSHNVKKVWFLSKPMYDT